MKRISLIILGILVSCGGKDSTPKKSKIKVDKTYSFKKELEEKILHIQEYKNTDLIILEGKNEEISPYFSPSAAITKEDMEDFKTTQYSNLLDIADEIFRQYKEKEEPNITILDFLKEEFTDALKNIKKVNEEKGIINNNIYIFSFIIDTFLISESYHMNISFTEYVKAAMEELKKFIDEYPEKKEIYFSVYDNESKQYKDNFIRIVKEIFNE